MPVDKGFQFIKDAGFKKVDLSIDTFLKNSDLYAGNVNRFFDASVVDLLVYFNDYRIAMERRGLVRHRCTHLIRYMFLEEENRMNICRGM